MWLLFLGLKEVFFNDYNFCMPFYTLPLSGYMDIHQRLEQHQWRLQCKWQSKEENSLIMLCYCFLLPINQCCRLLADKTMHRVSAHSCSLQLFTSKFLLKSMWLYLMTFWDFWTLKLKRKWKRWQYSIDSPHLSININMPVLCSAFFFNGFCEVCWATVAKDLFFGCAKYLCLYHSIKRQLIIFYYHVNSLDALFHFSNIIYSPLTIFSGASDRQYGAQWIPELIIQFHNSQFLFPTRLPSREQQKHRGICALMCGLSVSVSRRVRDFVQQAALNIE